MHILVHSCIPIFYLMKDLAMLFDSKTVVASSMHLMVLNCKVIIVIVQKQFVVLLFYETFVSCTLCIFFKIAPFMFHGHIFLNDLNKKNLMHHFLFHYHFLWSINFFAEHQFLKQISVFF